MRPQYRQQGAASLVHASDIARVGPPRGEPAPSSTPRRHALARRLVARGAATFLAVTGVLSFDLASAIGGTIARIIGPHLAVTRRARRNLGLALPHLSAAERRRIIREMWDNLGRTMAEYAHLSRLRCFAPGAHRGRRDAACRSSGCPRQAADLLLRPSRQLGGGQRRGRAIRVELAQIYRAANNPDVEAMMVQLRKSLGVEPIRKGAAGARRIIAALRQGKNLAMLVDQKMNDDIAVPFFGRPAMTAPALAELALRYDCTVLPVRVDRLGGARFRLTFFPPLHFDRSGDRRRDILNAMTTVNCCLEDWIRERPGQWFWLHRRWPES